MNNKQILMIVLDGVGDRPIENLSGKTPLQFAHTPNLDLLAQKGINGSLEIIGGRRIPNSSSGALALLGYDVNQYYPGDSMLEAAGMAVDAVASGDLTVHTSFATGDNDTRIIDRRVCRDLSSEEAVTLAADLTEGLELPFRNISLRLLNYRYYRNILVVKRVDGGKLSDQISNTDPAHKRDGYFDDPQDSYEMKVEPCVPLDDSPEALFSSKIINEFIKSGNKLLATHPINLQRRRLGRPEANLLITRNASSRFPEFPPHPKSIGMFVEMPAERAVGLLLGAKFIEHSYLANPSPDFYTDLARAVKRKIGPDNPEIIYVHTKGPDEPAHDGNFEEKVRVIEMIDRFFIGNLLDALTNNSKLSTIVTCDHATPCELKLHSADPVPVLALDAQWKADLVETFDEQACRQGRLGQILARELLGRLATLNSF